MVKPVAENQIWSSANLIVSEQCPAKYSMQSASQCLTMSLVCTCVREDHSKTRVSPFYIIHDPGACECITLLWRLIFFFVWGQMR